MAGFYENIAKGMRDREAANKPVTRTPLPGKNLKVQQETQQPLATKPPKNDVTGAPYQVRHRQVSPKYGGFRHLYPLTNSPWADTDSWVHQADPNEGAYLTLSMSTDNPDRPAMLPSEIASEYAWDAWDESELNKKREEERAKQKALLPSEVAKLTQKKAAEPKKSNGGETAPVKTAEVTSKNANEKASNFTGETLSGFMQSQGMDFSYGNRKKIAEKLGITNYKGTAEQNTRMLKLLKTDKTQTPTTRPSANLAVQELVNRNVPQIKTPQIKTPQGPPTWTPEQVLSGNGPQSGVPSQEEVNNIMALLVNRFKKGGSLDPAHAIQKSPLKHPELPEELKLGALKCGGSMAKSKKPKLKPKKK